MVALTAAVLSARCCSSAFFERGLLREIGRAASLLEIGAAFRCVVPVEHPERKIVDIGRDAEAENQHQKGGAEHGEGQSDRVAAKLERFADAVGEKPPEAEDRRRLLAGLQFGAVSALAVRL